MTEKVVTKKSFIGGRLVYPGETIDVDAKGEVLPAASTPIGAMTIDQLRSFLANAEAREEKREPEFGKNVADPTETNTGEQPLHMAPIAPSAPGAVNPQVAPPGSEETLGGHVHPAPKDAPAAIERVLPSETHLPQETTAELVEKFDHDGDGKPGGAPKGGNKKK